MEEAAPLSIAALEEAPLEEDDASAADAALCEDALLEEDDASDADAALCEDELLEDEDASEAEAELLEEDPLEEDDASEAEDALLDDAPLLSSDAFPALLAAAALSSFALIALSRTCLTDSSSARFLAAFWTALSIPDLTLFMPSADAFPPPKIELNFPSGICFRSCMKVRTSFVTFSPAHAIPRPSTTPLTSSPLSFIQVSASFRP